MIDFGSMFWIKESNPSKPFFHRRSLRTYGTYVSMDAYLWVSILFLPVLLAFIVLPFPDTD